MITDSDLTLAQLFALSDRIGNKYLSPQEIEERDRTIKQMIDDALLECKSTKTIAREAIASLEARQKHLDDLADTALSKYPLL